MKDEAWSEVCGQSDKVLAEMCAKIAAHEDVSADRNALFSDFYALRAGYMHAVDQELRAYRIGSTVAGEVGYLVCSTAEAAERLACEFGVTDLQLGLAQLLLRNGFDNVSEVP